MTKKFTPWFPGHIKPVRPGVYQQMCGHGKVVGYQLWDGKHWHFWEATPEAAAKQKGLAPAAWQNDPWRGLAAPAKGSTA